MQVPEGVCRSRHFRRCATSFGQGDEPASRGERRCVLQQHAQLGDRPRGDDISGIAERATARILGADRVHGDVPQPQLAGTLLEQSRPLAEGFQQVHLDRRAHRCYHEPGESAAAPHIDERAAGRPLRLGDAQYLQGFGVLALHNVRGGYRADPRVFRGLREQGRVPPQEGQPAFGIGEGGEEGRQVNPIECHGCPGAHSLDRCYILIMTNEVQVESPARVTLGEALSEYILTLKPEQRRAQEAYVRKYVEHTGDQVEIASLTGSKVESYSESQVRAADPNAPDRVAALKAWFQFLKKKNYANANFGVHIRVRKVAGRSGGNAVRLEEAPIEMTAEGVAQLRAELDVLNSRRPELVEAITLAREDKDFRENAPLDAAREALAFAEQRKKQIEVALKRAVVVERATADMSAIGSSVTVTHLDRNVQVTYRLVGGREANASEKKISVESPVGQKLLNRRVGDEVEVTVPQGTIRYRVDAISHSG